jgi:phage gp29-like protein
MRAVTALGHDARAIMPKDMELEVQKITGGGGDSAHLAMMQWAEKSLSKSILGQTLSADTGSKGGGSYALGKVHNEVRHDIRRSDARQIAATLTRDLVYPLIAVNKSGIEGLARCPRFVFDLAEAEDLTAYSDALPKLVGVGFQVPLSWAQEKLNIPAPKDGEPVLTISSPPPVLPPKGGVQEPTADLSVRAVAALTAVPNNPPAGPLADELAGGAAPMWGDLIGAIKTLVDETDDLATLQSALVATFGGQPQDALVKLMAAAFALAELKGMSDVQDGQ